MRFTGLEFQAMHCAERFERTSLINDIVGCFLKSNIHQSPSEAHQVGKAGMRTNSDSVLFCPFDGTAHPSRVTGVEPAGNIRMRDPFHHFFRSAQDEVPERFSHVTIEINPRSPHGLPPYSYLITENVA